MRTLGIEFASAPRKTAYCVLEWRARAAELLDLVVGADDDCLLRVHGDADVTGIDCPFGWPIAFLAFLCAVARPTGEAMPQWSHERRDELRFRVTDFRIHQETGRWPLSVASDLIGVAALRCQGLLTSMGVADRSGDGRVYEVYPAAALSRWGLPSGGYKGGAGRRRREALARELLGRAGWLRVDHAARLKLASSDDALDALIASLNARAAKRGLTLKPKADERRHGVREGWIALPEPGSFERLVGA
jgi:predicted nuclease with RNAse H fold